ncbi:MAG TPA: hypothetical protein VOB72_05775 [Candidatus Dormibacteraeota bacterium]|nr:hypothetical protein [Candidatus Dormibacteraeota bacterium]
MTYDQIVQGLRESAYELQNEGRLVWAGLKDEQDTASIVERYAWLYSDEALDAVAGHQPESEERERVRRALMVGIADRRAAPQQDRLNTFFAKAQAPVRDERVPFYTAQAQLATEADPRRREALEEGSEAVMAEAEELALEVEATVHDTIRGFGLGGYTEFWSAVKDVDYDRLRAELERVAAATAGRYRSWVEPRMTGAGRAYGDCPRAHVPYFRALPEHGDAYTAERFEGAMRRTFDSLGLDLYSAPTIHLDLADRPSKNPRACVWVPDAGREVHLLVRPSGGSNDYAAFLHEAGHALHFGLSDPGIGWPLANIGSEAYAELWSYLVEHIGHDPAWLAEALGLSDTQAERIAGDLAGVDLMLFMRYVGKLGNELELYAGDPLDAARGRAIYVSRLSAPTGFRYDGRAWQYDRDPGFYSADYLRAWLAEASLERSLRERFGERWWASRDAGAWLREQWRKGWAPEAEEVVGETGGRPWSGDALLERWAAA